MTRNPGPRVQGQLGVDWKLCKTKASCFGSNNNEMHVSQRLLALASTTIKCRGPAQVYRGR